MAYLINSVIPASLTACVPFRVGFKYRYATLGFRVLGKR